MKKIEFTSENYSFKQAMQQDLRDNIQPLLYLNNFNKYSTNKYVRELDNLAQIIAFNVEQDRLKAFAMFVPIFLPTDNILSYGIEITGSSGTELLNGKYFTTIYEKEKYDKHIQFEHYKEQHLDSFNKLILSIEEGILPEMNVTNSLNQFVQKFEGKEVRFFGHKFMSGFQNNSSHRFIICVNKCLNGQFEQGKAELENLKDSLIEEEIRKYIERLLLPMDGEDFTTEESFIKHFNEICTERRKKYKLIK